VVVVASDRILDGRGQEGSRSRCERDGGCSVTEKDEVEAVEEPDDAREDDPAAIPGRRLRRTAIGVPAPSPPREYRRRCRELPLRVVGRTPAGKRVEKAYPPYGAYVKTMDPSGEEELCRFGPMGISISFARPGLFVMTRRNNTEVVLTDRRLYGRGKMPWFAGIFNRGETPVFDVPIREIVAIEPVDFLANRAVRIRYRTPNGEKEVSIIGAALCHGHIARLMDLLSPLVTKTGSD